MKRPTFEQFLCQDLGLIEPLNRHLKSEITKRIIAPLSNKAYLQRLLLVLSGYYNYYSSIKELFYKEKLSWPHVLLNTV